MTIALAVALSACAGSGQPGYGGPSSVGTSGTARDAVDNGGSTSSSMESQRIKQAKGNTAPRDYFPGYGYGPGPSNGLGNAPDYGARYGSGPGYGPGYGYGRMN